MPLRSVLKVFFYFEWEIGGIVNSFCFCVVGLASNMVDALMKSSPNFLFLFFGRHSILPSTTMWQSILCTLFTRLTQEHTCHLLRTKKQTRPSSYKSLMPLSSSSSRGTRATSRKSRSLRRTLICTLLRLSRLWYIGSRSCGPVHSKCMMMMRTHSIRRIFIIRLRFVSSFLC